MTFIFFRQSEKWLQLYPRWEELRELSTRLSPYTICKPLISPLEEWNKLAFVLISENGLTQHFKLLLNSGEGDVDVLPFVGVLMKHPQLWQHLYKCLKEDNHDPLEWSKLMNFAYACCEWYHMTPRNDVAGIPVCHLQSNGGGYYEGAVPNVTNALTKSYITGCFTGDEFEEKLKVIKYVQHVLSVISEQIAEGPDAMYSFTPILSGSCAEEAKVGYPDEFDFLLKMHHFNNIFANCIIFKNSDSLTDIRAGDNSKISISWEINRFREILNDALKMHPFSPDFAVERLIPILPRLKPFTFVLKWLGVHFKYLSIRIDAVPAFEIDANKVKHSSLYHGDGYPVYVIPNSVGNHETDLRLSLSAHELGHIKTYPNYVKHAYCLAKAMRHTEICPSLVTDKGYTSVCDHISSYMIKTCLLHIMDDTVLVKQLPTLELGHDLLCPFSIAMAVKLYQEMQFYIVYYKGKIPVFFHRNTDACSRYTMAMFKRGEEEEKNLAKNIKIVLFFIRTMKYILVNNITSSCQHNCQWGSYHTRTEFVVD